jgi:hypothetical protein
MIRKVSKKDGRGFRLPNEFNAQCWNCCCSVCTGRRCPYPHGWLAYHYRCVLCHSGELHNKCIDCDFFENRYTVPRRFKIKSRRSKERSEILQKLDEIMKKLDIRVPDENSKG